MTCSFNASFFFGAFVSAEDSESFPEDYVELAKKLGVELVCIGGADMEEYDTGITLAELTTEVSEDNCFETLGKKLTQPTKQQIEKIKDAMTALGVDSEQELQFHLALTYI